MFQGVNSSYLPNSCEKLVGVKAFTSIFPYLLLYLCSTLHWVSKKKHMTVFLLIKTSSIIFFCLALLSVPWYLGRNLDASLLILYNGQIDELHMLISRRFSTFVISNTSVV